MLDMRKYLEKVTVLTFADVSVRLWADNHLKRAFVILYLLKRILIASSHSPWWLLCGHAQDFLVVPGVVQVTLTQRWYLPRHLTHQGSIECKILT